MTASASAARDRTLILVPGLLCNERVWAPQIRALESEWSIQVADHGKLDSLGGMAQAIIDKAPPRFAIAGHSMGGRVTLEVLRRVPERVTHVALLDTGAHPVAPGEAGQREAAGRYALLERARKEGMRAMAWLWLQNMVHPNRLNDQPLVEEILDMMSGMTPEIFEAQIRALLNRPDGKPVLQSIRCPTLILTGNEDSWAPPKQHEDMAALVPGSRLVVVPNCGHMSTLEQPEAVTEALRSWLNWSHA